MFSFFFLGERHFFPIFSRIFSYFLLVATETFSVSRGREFANHQKPFFFFLSFPVKTFFLKSQFPFFFSQKEPLLPSSPLGRKPANKKKENKLPKKILENSLLPLNFVANSISEKWAKGRGGKRILMKFCFCFFLLPPEVPWGSFVGSWSFPDCWLCLYNPISLLYLWYKGVVECSQRKESALNRKYAILSPGDPAFPLKSTLFSSSRAPGTSGNS